MWPTPTPIVSPVITTPMAISFNCAMLNEAHNTLMTFANTGNLLNFILSLFVVFWAIFAFFGVRIRIPRPDGVWAGFTDRARAEWLNDRRRDMEHGIEAARAAARIDEQEARQREQEARQYEQDAEAAEKWMVDVDAKSLPPMPEEVMRGWWRHIDSRSLPPPRPPASHPIEEENDEEET